MEDPLLNKKRRFESLMLFVVNHRLFLSVLVLTCVIILVYANSLSGIFLFDDLNAIPRNPTIRDLGQIGEILSPPLNSTVAARPLANLTFAVDYAFGGVSPTSYHVTNILIHIGAGLLLMGVVRRTLMMPELNREWGGCAQQVALSVALLWAVHPLQTESVTYVVQRVESLAGFFYLMTLYGFIRCTTSANALKWRMFTIFSCWLGMATKETMVSAPLIVLFYDRTFISGTLWRAWRSGRGLYPMLFGSWLLLTYLVVTGLGRNNTAGFGTGLSPWHYLLTQCEAIVMYFRLAVWPNPLVFDYGWAVIWNPMDVFWQGALLLVLAITTCFAVWRRKPIGMAGMWFFATLSPSSSIVPIATQTMAEHRMYLPLIPIIILFVTIIDRFYSMYRTVILITVGAIFCVMSVCRNDKYASAIVLWQDTVEKRPGNSRAHNDLGNALIAAGRAEEAIPHFQRAREISGDKDADANNNLGIALAALNRIEEASVCFLRALEIKTSHVDAMCNLGWLYANRGQLDDGERMFFQALRNQPNMGKALHGLAYVASKRNLPQEAIAYYNTAKRSDSHDFSIRINLAAILLKSGRILESEREYRQALVIEPTSFSGWFGLACALSDLSRLEEAILCYEKALQINAGNADAHNNLASILYQSKRTQEAIEHYRAAIRLDPKLVQAQTGLATLFAQQGRFGEAITCYEAALKLDPDDHDAHRNLGLVYQMVGDLQGARIQYREALRIQPKDVAAFERLKAISDVE